MSHVVIKTGGKQYVVAEGDRIKVEKLPTEAGKKIVFDEVLFAATDKAVTLGSPVIKGAKVEGKVLEQGRHKKLFGVKKKPKKRYQRVFGHRQSFTEVEITKITTK